MPPVPADPDAPVGAPLYPPRDWFARPAGLKPGQKVTVVTDGSDAGRVFGYVAPKQQCILSGRERSECWTVPDSPTNYAAAMQGEALTAEGDIVRVANIGGNVDHAPIGWRDFRKVVDHYSNTASQVMRVAYGADEHGVWCAGALWPEITHRQAEKVRASALSGDWRWRQELGAYDMAGAQMVNTPGFPLVPTIHARAAGLGDPHPALIGGWGGQPLEEPMTMTQPEPTLTLTLSASEAANLHRLLTSPTVVASLAEGKPLGTVVQNFTAAPGGSCSCGAHQAAPSEPMPGMEMGEDVDLATRVERLERQVEELVGEQMARGLNDVDAMTASMPLPPDLEDEHRWAMPKARTAAFDESKHPRHEKGTEGGGRFAPKVGDRVKVQTENGEVKGEVKEEWAPDTFTIATDDGSTIEAQTSDMEAAGPKAPGGPPRDVANLAARTDDELPGAKAKGSEARVVDTSHPALQELAAGDGRIDPNDPRVHAVAKDQGIPPGKVMEQANVMQRRRKAGTEGDFQKQLADSTQAVKDEDTIDALAGRPRGDVVPHAQPTSDGGEDDPYADMDPAVAKKLRFLDSLTGKSAIPMAKRRP